MTTVSREKYDFLKDKASKWRDNVMDYKRRYENILAENEKLLEENYIYTFNNDKQNYPFFVN